MKISNVKKLSPFERLCYWIEERSTIRLKKEANFPKPWTDDEILYTYKFCNVRRMDDRVSRWLWNNWYQKFRNHPNMLLACATARFVNTPAALDLITQDVFAKTWKPQVIMAKLRERKATGDTVFNGAYMVRGNDGVDKIESVIMRNVDPLKEFVGKIDPTSMEKTWNTILDSYGIGSFMGGQIVADLRWAVDGSWADAKTWAPAGPGSRRGLCRLLEIPLNTTGKRPNKRPTVNITQEDFLKHLRELIAKLKKTLPSTISSRIEAIDWQNCLCEYDKYTRALVGDGRPKQLYQGTV